MTEIYPVNIINGRLSVVESAIDGGALNGVLRLMDAGSNILSTIPLAKPAGTVGGGVLTFQGLSLIDPAAAASGIASLARIEDSNGNIIISGLTVGQTGSLADITLSPTNSIVAGQTVAMQQAQITGR